MGLPPARQSRRYALSALISPRSTNGALLAREICSTSPFPRQRESACPALGSRQARLARSPGIHPGRGCQHRFTVGGRAARGDTGWDNHSPRPPIGPPAPRWRLAFVLESRLALRPPNTGEAAPGGYCSECPWFLSTIPESPTFTTASVFSTRTSPFSSALPGRHRAPSWSSWQAVGESRSRYCVMACP